MEYFSTVDTALAAILMSDAMYFLCSHEMGHILLGHLSSDIVPQAAMSEDTLSAEDPEVSRCLERDADAFAAGAVLFRQIAIAGQQRTLGPEDILSNFRFPFCATYILLALMERPLHNGGMSKATHPPSLVRMMSLLPTCHAFLQSWRTGIEFDEMTEPVSLCTRAVELTLLSIGGGCLTNEEVDAGACP